MQIFPIRALTDNYMYVVVDNESKKCAAVDPVEPDKIISHVKQHGLQLESVLTTHHHWDHSGGNENLAEKMRGLKFFGSDDRIGALTDRVKDGTTFNIESLEGKCIFTPCHTSGHICYYVTDGTDKAVFTGDTLFIAGCGKFFEGTASQMYEALVNKLGSLPDDTKVFCGHEYTVQNLKYAQHADPNNADIQAKIEWAKQTIAAGHPTVPSTIAEEKRINPFMRVQHANLQKYAKSTDPIKAMQFLRDDKNNFR